MTDQSIFNGSLRLFARHGDLLLLRALTRDRHEIATCVLVLHNRSPFLQIFDYLNFFTNKISKKKVMDNGYKFRNGTMRK